MTTQALLILGGAGLLLALVSVLIDRLNFPQPRFRARTVVYDRRRGPRRDRTGAHIVENLAADDGSTASDPAGPGASARAEDDGPRPNG